MSIAKPFTFTANTYAKSSEVNADFDVVYAQVNSNISSIAQNATDIDNLENNKADINGSTSQRFAVADPITNGDAVNKQYLNKAIGNSVDYISGLVITKDSGSPEDTIIVFAGSCYDSTKSIVLTLSDSTSKQNLNQGANATYYVYIIGNATGSAIGVLISTSSTTPTLPSGYTLFRQIGYFTTDSNSKINSISYYGNIINGDNSPNGVANKIIPNYSTGITTGNVKGSGNAYTIPYNCFCIVQDTENTETLHTININGNTVPCWNNSDVGYLQVPYTSFYLSQGDVVYTNTSATLRIYKLKGDV